MKITVASPSSSDGSIKYRILLDDDKAVEAVFLPSNSSHGVCVSTQVGCNMGCTFCATGRQKMGRNLHHQEISDQVSLVSETARPGGQLDFVTLAGMGEPLANYQNSLRALDEIRDTRSPSVLSLSTVGLTPQIDRMRRDKRRDRLYISLHGADDPTRARTLPMATFYPIGDLLRAATAYAERLDVGDVHISYLLLPGINDGADQLEALVGLLRGRPLVVQMLFWNAVPGMTFRRSTGEAVLSWIEGLLAAGVPAYAMASKGRDIGGACGQLAT